MIVNNVWKVEHLDSFGTWRVFSKDDVWVMEFRSCENAHKVADALNVLADFGVGDKP